MSATHEDQTATAGFEKKEEQKRRLRDSMQRTARMHPVKVNDSRSVMSIGFLVERAEDAIVWRGPLKFGAIRQFLSDVAWGDLDDLVIDCPPGTGDAPLTVAQLAGRPASALVVTTPQQLAIADVRRCITFCKKVTQPVAGIIENMSGFVCPHCGGTVDLFGRGGGEKLGQGMGVPFLGRVPMDPMIASNGDRGKPFVSADAQNPSARALLDIVETLADTDAAERSGPGRQAT